MSTNFITITGTNHYLGLKPFAVGRIVRLVKDTDNEYDEDAIRVDLPFIDTVGYVANSTSTVYKGTCSAGRVYDKIDDIAFARVMFITHSSVIAAVLSPEETEKVNNENRDLPIQEESSDKNTFEDQKPKNKKKWKIGF